MFISSPRDRFNVKIFPREKVLDVGGGNEPLRRANVVVDRYERDNTHRGYPLKLYKHQEFVNADGSQLPFGDKEFDYVNCCHVAEHLPDPAGFFEELGRVGKRGYLEVPSLIGEFLAPKSAHVWVSLNVQDKLVMMKKQELGMEIPPMDFGKLFLDQLSKHSLAFKILIKQYPDLFTVRQYWEDKISYLINPEDPSITGLFKGSWPWEIIHERFMVKGKLTDIMEVGSFFCKICINKIGMSLSPKGKFVQ